MLSRRPLSKTLPKIKSYTGEYAWYVLLMRFVFGYSEQFKCWVKAFGREGIHLVDASQIWSGCTMVGVANGVFLLVAIL